MPATLSDPILLVEDDAAIATVIIAALEDEGFAIAHCSSIAARDKQLAGRRFSVMLTDVILEDGDGLASLSAVRDRAPDMPVIVLSAQNTLDTAVRASESDAFEYFPKPFDLDELVHAVRQAAGARAPAADEPGNALAGGEGEKMPLVGRSPAMQGVYRMITRVLRNDLTVLVTGESGTGKELVAEAIHELGNRRTGPFVAVNTAAIPADLVESELFGHEKGAFTGAIAQAIGKFEQANGGTLFLDEVGELPLDAQVKLLRAIQESEVDPVGGKKSVRVDIRVISATNKSLLDQVKRGEFREDLYYRLNVFPITLPPLRQRREDIPDLARGFLARFAAEEGKKLSGISSEAMTLIASYDWAGNVRQLENAMFRAVVLADGGELGVAEFPQIAAQMDGYDVRIPPAPAQLGPADAQAEAAPRIIHMPVRDPNSLELVSGSDMRKLDDLERDIITFALAHYRGHMSEVSRKLGIGRSTLYRKLKDYGLIESDGHPEETDAA